MRHVLRGFAALAALAATLGLPGSVAAGTQFQYDALGRLTRVTYETGVVVQYSYDAAGNRSQVVASGINRPPVANNDGASVLTSGTVDILVRANDSDPDGDNLTVTAVGVPTGGGSVAIQGGGSHVRYTAPATTGARTFTYSVADGRGGTGTATVTVNVSASNGAPIAVNDSASVNASASVDITVRANDSDPDGDPLTVTAVSTPAGGGSATIEGGGGHVRYAAPSTGGIRTFTYTVSDGRGGAASATVSINVTVPNRPPVAVDDGAEVNRLLTTAIHVLANDGDPDGQPLIVSSVTTPARGRASVAAGGAHVLYDAPGVTGLDSFYYTVSDGAGGSATGKVNILVQRPPVCLTPPPYESALPPPECP